MDLQAASPNSSQRREYHDNPKDFAFTAPTHNGEDRLMNELLQKGRKKTLFEQAKVYQKGQINRTSDDRRSDSDSEYNNSSHRQEHELKNEFLRLNTAETESISSRSSRKSRFSDKSRNGTIEQRHDRDVLSDPETEYGGPSFESGLNEERFPSYVSPKNFAGAASNDSDAYSMYSTYTETDNGEISPVTHPRHAPIINLHPPSPSSSTKSNRRKKSRVKQIESTYSYETEQTLPNKSALKTRDQIELGEQPRLHSPDYSPANRRSPRSSKSSGGHRKSRSITSKASGRGSVTHQTIPEDGDLEILSGNETSLHAEGSQVGSPRPSPSSRSRTYSSGRDSQSSHHESHLSIGGQLMGDTDSIGSASSIMMRSHSRTSKSSGNKSLNATDPDDEILVGDEKSLHDAARRGECDVVEELLNFGTDINCRNENDRTPLHWVAGNGHIPLLKIMLNRDANIEAADKFGMNALLFAAWFGHQKCVQLLLRAGAKPEARNKNGYTFIHCAAQNNHGMIEHILTEDLQDFDRDTADDSGRTCLHVAAKYGRKEMVEKFIRLKCNVNAKDKAGNTPLHLAAKYGFPEIVTSLVNEGAKMEEKCSEHKTALHLAADEGQVGAVEALIDAGADINAETEDEMCPLHLAVSSGHEEAAIALINGGADVDAGNKHNQTPLHYAILNKQSSLVQVLILHNADANVQDARRETALHLAAENGQPDITETLLHADINLSLTDQRGKTPLDVAARGSFTTIVDMIIKAERHHLFLKASRMNNGFQNEPGDPRSVAKLGESNFYDPPDGISFTPDNTPETQHIRMLLYKLATKYLKKDEWRKLAFQWGFTDPQVQAIEEQYVGEKSYRAHGYRMLLIWLNGCLLQGGNPTRLLFEGLVAIQRRELAETMRTKANALPTDKPCVIS